jgi:hypothetical protein
MKRILVAQEMCEPLRFLATDDALKDCPELVESI